jgi:hypothetical protein
LHKGKVEISKLSRHAKQYVIDKEQGYFHRGNFSQGSLEGGVSL